MVFLWGVVNIVILKLWFYAYNRIWIAEAVDFWKVEQSHCTTGASAKKDYIGFPGGLCCYIISETSSLSVTSSEK